MPRSTGAASAGLDSDSDSEQDEEPAWDQRAAAQARKRRRKKAQSSEDEASPDEAISDFESESEEEAERGNEDGMRELDPEMIYAAASVPHPEFDLGLPPPTLAEEGPAALGPVPAFGTRLGLRSALYATLPPRGRS